MQEYFLDGALHFLLHIASHFFYVIRRLIICPSTFPLMILVSIDDCRLQLLFRERMKNGDFKILFFLEDYSGSGKLSSISDGARHAKGSGVTGSPSARDGQVVAPNPLQHCALVEKALTCPAPESVSSDMPFAPLPLG